MTLKVRASRKYFNSFWVNANNNFCIAVVDLAAEGKQEEAVAFFEEEYKLDYFIGTMKTPYVSIMDGITSMCIQSL